MGAVLLLLSSHEACGDLDECLGLALLGCSSQAAPQLWGRAPGQAPLQPLFPEVCRGRAGLPQPPRFLPYLRRRGGTIGSFIPSHPGRLCGK